MSDADVLDFFGACLEHGDAAGAASLFAPDARYAEPPKFAFRGRDALRAFFADFVARHSAVEFRVLRALSDASHTVIAAEWRFAYTSNASGARQTFEGMSFVELRDGLIASWRGFSALLPEHPEH